VSLVHGRGHMARPPILRAALVWCVEYIRHVAGGGDFTSNIQIFKYIIV
jgi:hypothetical protein